MRDEYVVYDSLMRNRQRKALERRGEIAVRSLKATDALDSGYGSRPGIGWYVDLTVDLDYAENAPPVSIGLMPHGGARSVARNSKWSYRGFLIYDCRIVQHESRNEKNVAQILMTWPEVVNIWSQTPRVRYPDASDDWHYYTFDYLVLLRDGRRIAVSVKPEERREEEKAILEQIVSVPQSEFDETFVFTDAQATRTAAFNARFILWCRKNTTEEEVMAAREMMYLFSPEMFLWQLYDNGVPHHLRKSAIGKLIDNGELVLIDPLSRITDWCQLAVVH
ncbi:hypothetical protein ELH93_28520 (plasmid) [Rhizobium leguminosarum]|uniref:TnsA endonuclease N-terminal domain-containing protein n=1 Tax=Rhizobium leguminosarum TaxID=384 RepID=UPI001031083D|nr:TnsA endonuclease N-terminal domain-containing protein [Rhizobium leguminosarum]TAY27674.1 hypothetical protein ELH93_28520 [Rhizobium leguminosarum]